MALLDFNPPAKVEIEAGFDGGPDGGYAPQMSDADSRRWKAKSSALASQMRVLNYVRASVGGMSGRGPASQVHVIVALDGWDYGKKFEKRGGGTDPKRFYDLFDTTGLNVRMSMNGPLLMTFDVINEINQIVQEAQDYLETNQED